MRLNQDHLVFFVFELPLFLFLVFNYGLHWSLFWISSSGKQSELTFLIYDNLPCHMESQTSIALADALSLPGHRWELSSLPGVVCLQMPSNCFSSDTIPASWQLEEAGSCSWEIARLPHSLFRYHQLTGLATDYSFQIPNQETNNFFCFHTYKSTRALEFLGHLYDWHEVRQSRHLQKILDLWWLYQVHLECIAFISHSKWGVKRNNMKKRKQCLTKKG